LADELYKVIISLLKVPGRRSTVTLAEADCNIWVLNLSWRLFFWCGY